jgi:hypothetical protein
VGGWEDRGCAGEVVVAPASAGGVQAWGAGARRRAAPAQSARSAAASRAAAAMSVICPPARLLASAVWVWAGPGSGGCLYQPGGRCGSFSGGEPAGLGLPGVGEVDANAAGAAAQAAMAQATAPRARMRARPRVVCIVDMIISYDCWIIGGGRE